MLSKFLRPVGSKRHPSGCRARRSQSYGKKLVKRKRFWKINANRFLETLAKARMPLGVAEYQATKMIEELKSELPSIDDLEKTLEK